PTRPRRSMRSLPISRRCRRLRHRHSKSSDQRRNAMRNAKGLTLGSTALSSITGLTLLALAAASPANAADRVLSGTIKSAAGAALGGITVPAKPAGGTITTTVFTDESGNYYFPPLPEGKYRVWAQALSFETAKGEVDLAAAAKENFTLKPMADAEG